MVVVVLEPDKIGCRNKAFSFFTLGFCGFGTEIVTVPDLVYALVFSLL